MATKLEKRKQAHRRRKMRVRKRVNGTSERPRLVINRTLRYMQGSLVDDFQGMVLTGATTRKLPESNLDLPEKPEEFKVGGKKLPLRGKVADAYRLGLYLAELAKEKGIDQVVFDRNGLRYHGRVRAVAEGARKGGLTF